MAALRERLKALERRVTPKSPPTFCVHWADGTPANLGGECECDHGAAAVQVITLRFAETKSNGRNETL